jgi:hypothetical protein
MTLEQTFFLSQTIAAAAVVISIIYLARQVNQAERVQRAIMQQGRADRSSRASMATAHAELARIWQKGLSGEPDLTREEFVQWSLVSRASFLSGEDSVLQHKRGMLDEPAFSSYKAGIRAFLAFPGFRAMWHVSRSQYGSDFQHFIDTVLATLPDGPPPDLYAVWQERLKAELAPPQVLHSTSPRPG